MFKIDWEKAEEKDQIANILWNIEKGRELQKNISFTDYIKLSDCTGHKKLWKILKEMGIQDHLTCMQGKKQQLEPDMEHQTGSKLGKEYVKNVYCHPVYLIYMQSISCKMLDWMKPKMEWRLPGEISINSICRWHHS